MRTAGIRRSLSWATFMLLVGALLLTPMVGFGDIEVPTKPSKDIGPPNLDLMENFKHVLSGRPWLIAEGIDPGIRTRPEWSALTRLDWRSNGGMNAGMGTPALQAAGGFLVPYRSAAPAFSRDLLISRDFSNSPIQTEPHIAVDPDDPDHLVVGLIDYNFPSITTYVSMDGGAVWEGPNQGGYLPDDLVSGGDPVLDFDRDGNVYMATISIGVEEFTVGPVATSSLVSSIAVAKSEDGGYKWQQIVSTARSGVSIADQQIDPSGRLRGTVSIGFLDKPWMEVGRHPTNAGADVIYVTYTHFEVYYDIIYTGELPILLSREMATTVKLVRSDDEGETWTDPLSVSPTVRRVFGSVDSGDAPGMFGSDRTLQGARPVVDKNGNLYVAWLDSTDDGSMEGLGEMYASRSEDGGKTFSTPVIAAVFNELPFRPRTAYFRYWGSSFPRIAVGNWGELYIVYTARPIEKPSDDGDIFFIRSLDKGETWSNPILLNDDEYDALQFFPEIAVSPDGTIHVMWADMRDDPIQTRYHMYYTQSSDRGSTWGFEIEDLGIRSGDARVTDFASNPNKGFPYGLFIGDYFGMAASDEDVYMVWADTRLGEFGGVNQKIGFTRRRAIRRPDIFVSPSAGPGGESITIQGFNFQPDMNVMIQLADAAIATARTNADGRFTTGIYIPVTGEGPQSIRVFDESGNFASTSFYTEFGFGNIEQLYQDLLRKLDDLNQILESER